MLPRPIAGAIVAIVRALRAEHPATMLGVTESAAQAAESQADTAPQPDLDEFSCDWCGAFASRPSEPDALAPWWWVEDGDQIYCSKRCRHKARRAEVPRENEAKTSD